MLAVPPSNAARGAGRTRAGISTGSPTDATEGMTTRLSILNGKKHEVRYAQAVRSRLLQRPVAHPCFGCQHSGRHCIYAADLTTDTRTL